MVISCFLSLSLSHPPNREHHSLSPTCNIVASITSLPRNSQRIEVFALGPRSVIDDNVSSGTELAYVCVCKWQYNCYQDSELMPMPASCWSTDIMRDNWGDTYGNENTDTHTRTNTFWEFLIRMLFIVKQVRARQTMTWSTASI